MMWILKMAWRDSRSSWRRLILFSLAMVFGIAALVSIRSFGDNLESSVNDQSKRLLGADLVLTSRQPLSLEAKEFIRDLGGEQARETNFSSMIYFPATGESRLVQVRGLEEGFPWYGEFETVPGDARKTLYSGSEALLEENLLVQFGMEPGDVARIGGAEFRIGGMIRRIPGESIAVGLLAPRVIISFAALEDTGLLRQGSLARHKVYLHFPEGRDVEALVAEIGPALEGFRISHETVEQRRRSLGRASENLYRFLNLAGIAALLLGSIGVGSSVTGYVKQKRGAAAILRCLGASSFQTVSVYLVQAIGMGILGSLLGALLGVVVQRLIPLLLADFLPFEAVFSISWSAIGQGISVGFLLSFLFALLPLVSLRRVSPLSALRSGFLGKSGDRDPLRFFLYALLSVAVVTFSVLQTGSWSFGAGVAVGLGAVFLFLAGVARLLLFLVRRFFPSKFPYVWRQGQANLYRPNNQTVLLVLALGLGTFLILTLVLSRDVLLDQVQLAGGEEQANMALFDIQEDQSQPVADLLRTMGFPLLQQTPIVTMRLASLRGKPVEEILSEGNAGIPSWTLRREYRSTYRSHTANTESILEGEWVGAVEEFQEPVPISLEQGIAEDLGLDLGDEVVFDVQGVPITTFVGSLRRVDWQQLQPNFFVVFPLGVLEAAPQFHVLVTRTNSPEESAALQRAVVREFPNVSAIDLTLILQTVDSIFGRISFVLQFMVFFTVGTGTLVLAGAVVSGRRQRLRESTLLRVMGASRRQLLQIVLIEYFFLGTLSAMAGVLLATGAAWALAFFVFEAPFFPGFTAPFLAWAGVVAVTLATGLATGRGIYRHPPLDSLRREE